MNRITDLAARLLGSAAAQVSLLSDVQTVAAGTGPARDAVNSQGPLAHSLCTVTAATGAPLVVPDAANDSRVSELPPVASGAVGSYLGVPLANAEGDHVGALCVFDLTPREWSPSDVAVLEQLARAVVTELELSALSADHRADRAIWALAAEAGGVGTFDLDLVTGELVLDDRQLELSGLDGSSFSGRPEDVYAHVHRDDVGAVMAAVQRAIDAAGSYQAEYRVVLPDGSYRWVSALGRVVKEADGSARLIGVAHDTTATRAATERIAHALESMAVGYLATDPDWRVTYVNAEAERALGQTRDALVGHVLWDLFPATVGTVFEAGFRRAADTGKPYTFDAYYPEPLNAWFEIRATPEDAGVALYFLDITERVRLQRRNELLSQVTAELTGTLDAEEAVARLAQLVVPALADWCVVTLVDDDHQPRTLRGLRDVAWWHKDPEIRPVVQAYTRHRIPALRDISFLARALSNDRTVTVEQNATARIAEVLVPGAATDLLDQLAPEAFAVLPLRGRGRTVGLLTLFNGRASGPITAQHLVTAADIAARAGQALENARLYRAQRQLAEGLQRSLLTAPTQPDHLQVVVRYRPAAATAQVGGDWYDAFLQPGGNTVLTVGDVLGHNTEAAASMGQLRSMLRAIAVTTGAGPAEILRRVDAAMTTLELTTTATAVVARLHQSEEQAHRGVAQVVWSNAGHPTPMVVNPDGTVLALSGPRAELLLGVDDTVRRQEFEATLDRDAVLLLYTDGLIERRDATLDDGLERLRQALADLAGRNLDDLCDELLARMLPDDNDDDVALLALRLHRQERPPRGDPAPA